MESTAGGDGGAAPYSRRMLTTDFLSAKFSSAKPYSAYMATGSPPQQEKWREADGTVRLKDSQTALVAGFTRRLNVLVLSGIWCGDCSAQCPMLARIAEANPKAIDLRFLDRDQNLDLAEPLKICGGLRVPTALFMNEEFDFVSLLGDRTLARYRAVSARKLGALCPLPGAPEPADVLEATIQDWLNEFERVHLLLRLSPKLRAKHGD